MAANVYVNYYSVQSGSGINDIGPLYYHPRMVQQGRGIGNFFAALYQYLKPIFTSGVNVLKEQALKTGTSIINDLGNRPFTEIIKEHGKKAADELGAKLKNKFQGGSGIFTYRRGGVKKYKRADKSSAESKKKKRKTSKAIKSRILDIFSNQEKE